MGFVPSMYNWFTIQKSINVINHINKLKKKNHMTIFNRCKKAFNKIQPLFMIKTLSKLEIEGNFLNMITNIYKTHIANIFSSEKFKAFPLRPGTKQGCLLSPLFLENCTGIPS